MSYRRKWGVSSWGPGVAWSNAVGGYLDSIWRCSECAVTMPALAARGAPLPFNGRVQTCSAECARKRKHRLQRERREARRRSSR
jgi:hypothetical protein